MSDEFNGTDEFHRFSAKQDQNETNTQSSRTAATAPSQSDRPGQHRITIPARSDTRAITVGKSTTAIPPQSDRLRPRVQHDSVGSSAAPGGGRDASHVHEDFDLVVEDCRRGRITKSSAT